MKLFYERYIKRYLGNSSGIAALMGVILAIAILATIALNFFATTQQKQSGSALTYSSASALMVAEAGLRYAAKCLLNNDANCPCNTGAPNDCNNWLAMPATFPTVSFGDTRGKFDITLAPVDADNVRVTSKGTFSEAIRVISKNVSRQVTCKLGVNAITACSGISFNNNAGTSGTTETGYCPATPLVDPLTFSPDPSGCPNANYPDFSAGSHLDGSSYLTRFQFCNMSLSGSQLVKVASGNTVWIAKNLTMQNLSTMDVYGTVTVNVGGTTQLQNLSDVEVLGGGSLTLHSDGDFSMTNSVAINQNAGDPAKAIVLVKTNATIANSATLVGGLIANGTVTLQNNAEINGSIMGSSVTMKNNSYINYAPAGSGTTGVSECNTTTPLPSNWKEGG